jgi:dihydrofolate synthase/folylpolyglutamate synthase
MKDLFPEVIQKLFNVNLHGALKSGLDNISKLNQIFKKPDQKFQSVHVAGTNGKGSVTVKIGKALELAGYRVGVFTSPHITSFCERISIHGKNISEQDVVKHLTPIFEVVEKNKIPATFFEITTMLAIKYFAEQGVDWAVFETGLGGRYDATNILLPKLSVITSISLDHTDILGDTLEKIAYEKAGIIKQGIPVLLGPRTPFVPRVAPFHEVKGDYDTTELENREIASQAMQILNIPLHSEALEARLPCRMEKFKFDQVNVILDVAHNPDGLLRLFKALKNTPLRIVFGMSKTKDLEECVKIIKAYSHHIHLVDVPDGRGYPSEDVAQLFDPITVFSSTSIKVGILNALDKAKECGETVLVCGSCYIMGEARKTFNLSS